MACFGSALRPQSPDARGFGGVVKEASGPTAETPLYIDPARTPYTQIRAFFEMWTAGEAEQTTSSLMPRSLLPQANVLVIPNVTQGVAVPSE